MASYASVQSALWYDYDEQSRFFARMKRTLALSFGLHLVVLLIAMGLRLPHHGERPLTSVEVSLVSLPTPPTVKPVEPSKPMESAKVPESKPAPPAKTDVPSPMRPAAPPVGAVKRDILRDLELPPDAPKFGELSPAKSIAQPQPAAKIKVPDLPLVPDLTPEPVKKAPQRAALTEDLNRELDEELKKIKQFQPAAKLEIPKETKLVETPAKPTPSQEAKVSPAKMPDTMLKISGAPGSNPYWARVQSIISSHWEPPPIDMSGQVYTVVVKFRLQRDGVIKDVAVQQTSGNDYYDMAGRRAVLKPRVLPPFPADMTDGYKDVEMVFRVGEVAG